MKKTFQLLPSAFIYSDALSEVQPIPMQVNSPRYVDIQLRIIQLSGVVGNILPMRGGLTPVKIDIINTDPSALKVQDSVTFSIGEPSKSVFLTPGTSAISISRPAGFAAPPKTQASYSIK